MFNFNFIRVGFSSYRLVRLWQRDSITQGVRDATQKWLLHLDYNWLPIPEKEPQRHGRKWGYRQLLAELLACFFCLSVWAAMFMALFGKRRAGNWFLDAMAGAGVAAVLQDSVKKSPEA